MAFSIESAIVVPTCILILASVSSLSFRTYDDGLKNAQREAKQKSLRFQSTSLYEQQINEKGELTDVHTKPVQLLRFCMYLEDQGGLLKEVFADE